MGCPADILLQYQKDNWCARNFMECEGDCEGCPNRKYWAAEVRAKREQEIFEETGGKPRILTDLDIEEEILRMEDEGNTGGTSFRDTDNDPED